MRHRKQTEEQEIRVADPTLNHVGGITDTIGGVDPEIEQTLLRLSGGP